MNLVWSAAAKLQLFHRKHSFRFTAPKLRIGSLKLQIRGSTPHELHPLLMQTFYPISRARVPGIQVTT